MGDRIAVARESTVADELGDIEAKAERLRTERDRARSTAARLEERVAELTAALGVHDQVATVSLTPPKWTAPKRTRKEARHKLTAWLHFSDWHFDEKVDLNLLGGVNLYNRRVGEQRLDQWAAGVARMVEYQSAFDYEACHVSMNGDVLSGWIHDLGQHNDGTGMFHDVEHWATLIASKLSFLADLFGHVWVTVTIGNHGRTTQKPTSKHSVATNLEYLLGRMLALHVTDPRIRVDVSESPDVLFPIYDLTVLQTHGNTGHSGTGGNGQAGIWTVVNKIVANKRSQLAHQRKHFDVLALGHFHQFRPAAFGRDGVIVNGSGKGFDEYARDKGYPPEDPVQAFASVSPERGITDVRPVFVSDRKAEGW